MVQHNAARFIANAYYSKRQNKYTSITKIIESLKLVSFEERRNRSRLIMAYKILNSKVILGPEYLPKTNMQKKGPMRSCNSSTVGSNNHLVELSSRLQVTSNTFFYATPKLWN